MAREVPNTPIADIQGNATLMAEFPKPLRPTVWSLNRPRTNQPARVKLDNRAQRKGYFC